MEVSKINLKETFRNLVTNKYMPAVDYSKLKFSFRTSCKISPGVSHNLFKGCSCSVEHEYLLYYGDDGQINEEMYNRVLQNITNGKCPHVDDTKAIVKTTIHAIYIAAAVNTHTAVKQYIDSLKPKKSFFQTCYVRVCQPTFASGVFQLRPYHIAIIKKSYKTCNEYLKSGYTNRHRVYYIDNPGDMFRENCSLKFDILTDQALCAKVNNLPVFKLLAGRDIRYASLYHVLKSSQKHSTTDTLTALKDYINWLDVRDDFMNFVSSFIDYEYFSRNYARKSDRLLETKDKFKRRLLQTFDKESNTKLEAALNAPMNVNEILHVLHNRKKEFIDSLQGNHVFMDVLCHPLHVPPPDEFYICVNYWLNPTVLRILLELGMDVDILDAEGKTPLIFLLSERLKNPIMCLQTEVREMLGGAVQLLIYENSSIKLNTTAVDLALKHDKTLYDEIVDYIARSPDHFWDENMSAFSEIAMENAACFLAPLLIECGFSVSSDLLSKTLDEKTLHPVELVYLQECLDTPRRLTHKCRDVIRKSFKGRSLHGFVERSHIPMKIKDFILINWLLAPR